VARKIRVWTWDAGARDLDVDGDPLALGQVLQTVLDGGLWGELRKFPADAVARVLPRLQLRPETRGLVEIWIEERTRPPA
jgi:hypothetical protein